MISYGEFARSAADSEKPELWNKLAGAWIPSLGCTGSRLFDLSGRNNHGTGVGGPTWTTNKLGPTMVFNGSSQYVNVGTLGNFGSLLGYGLTIECWIKSSVTNTNMCLFGTQKDSASKMSLSLRVNSGEYSGSVSAGGMRFVFTDNFPRLLISYVSSNTGITNGNAHHLAVRVSPSSNTIEIYLDGNPLSVVNSYAQTPATFESYSQPLYFGAMNLYGTASQFFNGQISCARLWNRVLSPSQIRELYTDPLGMFRIRSDINNINNNFLQMF